jgi:hypothetical protein
MAKQFLNMTQETLESLEEVEKQPRGSQAGAIPNNSQPGEDVSAAVTEYPATGHFSQGHASSTSKLGLSSGCVLA